MKEVWFVFGLVGFIGGIIMAVKKGIPPFLQYRAQKKASSPPTPPPVPPVVPVAVHGAAPQKKSEKAKSWVTVTAYAVCLLAITYRIIVSGIGATNDQKRREEIIAAEIAALSQGQLFVRNRHMQTFISLPPQSTSEPIPIAGAEGSPDDQAADWWPKTVLPEVEVLEILQVRENGGMVWKTNAYPYTPRGTPRRNIDRSIAFRNNSSRTITIEFVRGTAR